MGALPNDLALVTIADAGDIDAAPLRNDFAAVQAAFNQLNDLLAGGAAGQLLVSDGVSAISWGLKITTSAWAAGPPSSPSDGDIWVATNVDGASPASNTNGTRWQFQYNAGSASTYKWEFLGGAPFTVGYGNVATTINAGTQIGATGFYTAPGLFTSMSRAGDWRFEGNINIYTGGSASGGQVQLQPFQTSSALVGGYASQIYAPSSYNGDVDTAADMKILAQPASTNMGWAVNTPANGTYAFAFAALFLTPIRIA